MPVLTFDATKNVSISSKYTSQSYTGNRLAFGRGSSGDEYQLLIGFETIALPANSVVDSATLTVPKTTGALGSYAGFTAQVVRLTSAFTTASSWDSGKPSYTTANAATAETGVDHTGNVVFDVTAMVKDWLGGEAQYGVALRKSISGGTYIKVAVDNGAYITVTYHLSASTFTTDGSATIGVEEDITISAANSGYTHDLTLTVGRTTYTLATGKTEANLKTFTIPMEACALITNATSGTGTLSLTTKNGSATVGSPVTQTISVAVPSSVVPTISGLTAAVAGNSVAVDGGVYLKGITKALLTAGAAAGDYGSTIKSYTFSGNGWSVTGSDVSVETPFIATSGNITYTVKVTDSRGRTASASVTISVADYSNPVLTVAQAVRADETGTPSSSGTYILVTAGASVTNVLNNAATITAAVTLQGSSAVLWSGALTDGSLLLADGGAAEANDYAVTITATDSFGKTAVTTLAVLHSGRTINVTEDGTGVAIGGFAEPGAFTSHIPAVFSQGLEWTGRTGLIGIGTFTGDIDSITELPANTCAWLTPDTTSNPSGGYALLETWGATNGVRIQRKTNYSSMAWAMRMYGNGAWTEWAWGNPPMLSGVEYLTMERYNGKPVYVRLQNCGTAAASLTKAITVTGVTNIVRANVRCGSSEGMAIINGSLSAANNFTYFVSATTNTINVYSYAGSGRTGQTVYATIYYTK